MELVQRETVWCGFWAGGIIGPYFFKNKAALAVSVNGLRYQTMINELSRYVYHYNDKISKIALFRLSLTKAGRGAGVFLLLRCFWQSKKCGKTPFLIHQNKENDRAGQ